MKFYNPLVLLAFLFTTLCVSAQQQPKVVAQKDIDVIKVYEQVIKEGYGTKEVFLKLANEHYFKSNYSEAKVWFEKSFDAEKPTDKKIILRYKQTLKALQLNVEENPYLVISGTH